MPAMGGRHPRRRRQTCSPFLANVCRRLEHGRGALVDNRAVAHHIEAMAYFRGDGELLLNHSKIATPRLAISQRGGLHARPSAREALGWFIDHDEVQIPIRVPHIASIICSPPDNTPPDVSTLKFGKLEDRWDKCIS